jgi:hypothetical protein
MAEKTRTDFYAALEPKLNSGAVELLDQPELLSQLIGLVRKGEKIDHVGGEHDDFSNAVAGVVGLLATEAVPLLLRSGGVTIGFPPSPVPPPTPNVVTRAVQTITGAGKSVADAVRHGAASAKEAMVRVAEQAQEAVHREPQREPNDFERMILDRPRSLGYFPGDGLGPGLRRPDLDREVQGVRDFFALWR